MISVLSIMCRKFKLILLFHLKEEPIKEYLVLFHYLCSSSGFSHEVFLHWYFLEVGTIWHSSRTQEW